MASGIVHRSPGRPGFVPFVPATPTAPAPTPGIAQRGGGSGIVVRQQPPAPGHEGPPAPQTPAPLAQPNGTA